MAHTVATQSATRSLSFDRGRIPAPWLYAAVLMGVTPFALMGCRLAGLSSLGPDAMITVGQWLNRYVNLQWVSADDRSVVLYILILPIAALLTTVTRLTLGIRILGFRSILIAIGFQEIGPLASMLLLFVIAGIVVMVRPSMRRAGMPLFARVGIVLCIVAFTLLTTLLVGTSLDSVTLWSMTFFPVIILAMLAESIADTVARDGTAMAIWRTTATITLAAIIAVISQAIPLRELLLSCPEILLTPVTLIIIVSEFLDHRLLEGWYPFSKTPEPDNGLVTIALVRNRLAGHSAIKLNGEVPKRYSKASLQPLINTLRDRGHTVCVLECDATLPSRLNDLARNAQKPGSAGLYVLNLSGGSQGISRLSQVPAVCELIGLSHSGPMTQAPVFWADRCRQLTELQAAGLNTPIAISSETAIQTLGNNHADIVIRPRYQPDRSGTKIETIRQMEQGKKRVEKRFGEALIEQMPKGRSITVVLVCLQSRHQAKALPLLEPCKGKEPFRPAHQLDLGQKKRITDHAISAALALGCRDTARVDLIISESEQIIVSGVIAIDPPTARSATGIAASLGGFQAADVMQWSIHSASAPLTKLTLTRNCHNHRARHLHRARNDQNPV